MKKFAALILALVLSLTAVSALADTQIIGVPNDGTNLSRAIKLLETAGLADHIRQKAGPEKDPLIRDIENRMASKLGTKVVVSSKTITISYSDTADLNRILELIGMIEESDVSV